MSFKDTILEMKELTNEIKEAIEHYKKRILKSLSERGFKTDVTESSFKVSRSDIRERILESGILNTRHKYIGSIIDDLEREFIAVFEDRIEKTGNECILRYSTKERRMTYNHPDYGSIGANSSTISYYDIKRLPFYDEKDILHDATIYADHRAAAASLRRMMAGCIIDSMRDIEVIESELREQAVLMEELNEVEKIETLPGVTRTYKDNEFVIAYEDSLKQMHANVEILKENTSSLEKETEKIKGELDD